MLCAYGSSLDGDVFEMTLGNYHGAALYVGAEHWKEDHDVKRVVAEWLRHAESGQRGCISGTASLFASRSLGEWCARAEFRGLWTFSRFLCKFMKNFPIRECDIE